MQEILDAIQAGASGEELAALPIPESYRAAIVKRDEAGMFEGVESWEMFIARVNRGLSQFLSTAGKSETCAIFTSGGPVAVAVQRALCLSPQATLQLAWMPRNCSYAEFLFSADRFTLSTFNSFQHLDDPSLLTYR